MKCFTINRIFEGLSGRRKENFAAFVKIVASALRLYYNKAKIVRARQMSASAVLI